MIEIDTRIHDKFSIEFKTSFVTRRKLKDNDFSAFMWFFVPQSIDINKYTYSKSQFYQDMKSNVRLITPKFIMRDIAGGVAEPLGKITQAFHSLASSPSRTAMREYEYQIKMFAAITHSSARDTSNYIMSGKHATGDLVTMVESYVADFTGVLAAYRNLRSIISQPTITDEMMSCYRYGDEYMSNMMVYYCTAQLDFLLRHRKSGQLAPAIKSLQDSLRGENAYRESRGYVKI